MLNKKPAKPEKSAEEQALESRVDAMMSIESAMTAASVPKSTNKANDKKPVSKVTKSQKTAPELPDKLLKSVKGDEKTDSDKPAEPPIVISLVDESKADPPIVSEAAPDKPSKSAKPEALDSKPADSEKKDLPDSMLEDSDTDEAVDEIVADEGDMMLAVNDALVVRKNAAIVSNDSSPSVVKTLIWFTVFVLVLGIVYVSYHYFGI